MIRTGRLVLALLVTGLGALMMSSHGTTVYQAGAAGQYRLFAPQIGGDSSTGGLDPSAPPPVGSPSTRAKAMLLTLADFPSGWTSKPPANPNGSSFILSPSICAELRGAPIEVGAADAGSFSGPSGTTVLEAVAIYATPADATIALYLVPAFEKCFSKILAAVLAATPDAKVGAMRITPIDVPAAGDHTTALEIRFPITLASTGITLDAFIEVVAVQKGTALALMQAVTAVLSLDSTFLNELTAKAAARLN